MPAAQQEHPPLAAWLHVCTSRGSVSQILANALKSVSDELDASHPTSNHTSGTAADARTATSPSPFRQLLALLQQQGYPCTHLTTAPQSCNSIQQTKGRWNVSEEDIVGASVNVKAVDREMLKVKGLVEVCCSHLLEQVVAVGTVLDRVVLGAEVVTDRAGASGGMHRGDELQQLPSLSEMWQAAEGIAAELVGMQCRVVPSCLTITLKDFDCLDSQQHYSHNVLHLNVQSEM
jgi:hypothetical protein